MRSGHIKVEPLVTNRLRFDSLIETFPQLYDPETHVIKAIVEFL